MVFQAQYEPCSKSLFLILLGFIILPTNGTMIAVVIGPM